MSSEVQVGKVHSPQGGNIQSEGIELQAIKNNAYGDIHSNVEPSGAKWLDFEIGELCSVGSSKRIFAHDYVESGVPFYASKDVIDKALGSFTGATVFISKDRFYEIAKKFSHPKKGDLLLSSVGNRAGISWVVQDEGEFYFKDGNVTWFKDFKSLDSDFLCYWLKSSLGQDALQSIMIGSAQKALTISGLQKLKIKIPSLAIQGQIVSILKGIDDRIALLRETNATLEAMAQALFKSWFVDFDPVHANAGTRAATLPAELQALFPSTFTDTPQGPVPEGWIVKQLGDVAAYLNRGVSPKYIEEGGVLVINQKCIRDFAVDLSKARRHDPVQRKIDGRILDLGDILVNSTGVGTLGRIAQLLEIKDTMIVDSHVTVVRANSELSWPYLGQALMRKQPQIEEMGEGTTGQTELARSKLALLPIICPSSEVLAAFDDVVVPLKQALASNAAKAQTLATLRDTLLPRLISGQLRLPDAKTALAEVDA